MLNNQHLYRAVLALCAVLAGGLGAQTNAAPTFDVASVKQSKTDSVNSNFPLGPGDAYTANGGYFNATGFPLVTYISFAYKLVGNQNQSFMDQMPGWANTERYDIQARVAGNPGKEQMRLLMRALLAERFQLAIHEEERQVAVAALVAVKEGKLGPQIQEHPADAACPLDANPGMASEDPRFPLLCGGLVGMPPSVPGRLRFGGRNVTLELIGRTLSPAVASGRPIVNRSGLDGKFDFNLEFLAPARPGVEEQPDRSGPTFEEALRDQLGMKLTSQKGSVKVYVLDHVERPTEN